MMQPGFVGRAIRVLLALAVFGLGSGLVRNAPGFWDGISWSLHTIPLAAPIVLTSAWVVNELTRLRWGWWTLAAILGVMAVAAGISWALGEGLWGPVFGIAFWTWMTAWVVLLGPALLLAAILGTPGCEMRSYAHLIARLRGRDIEAVACPGWLDRLDGVRLR